MSSQRARPLVAVVTTHWGASDDEPTLVTRLLAGALATRADVEIVHLVTESQVTDVYADSVFRVTPTALVGSEPLRAAIVRAAVGEGGVGASFPRELEQITTRYEGVAPRVVETIEKLDPDALVLSGHDHPYDLAPITKMDRRVVLVPLLGDGADISNDEIRRQVDAADMVALNHPNEMALICDACSGA